MNLFGYKRSSSGIWGENGVQYATPFSSSPPPCLTSNMRLVRGAGARKQQSSRCAFWYGHLGLNARHLPRSVLSSLPNTARSSSSTPNQTNHVILFVLDQRFHVE